MGDKSLEDVVDEDVALESTRIVGVGVIEAIPCVGLHGKFVYELEEFFGIFLI
jgi:hypothetical protein